MHSAIRMSKSSAHRRRRITSQQRIVFGCLVALIVSALMAISVRQSGAYWTSNVAASASTISSGALVLTAGGSHNLALTSLGGTALNPGSRKTVSVTVANGGDTTLGYKLTNVATSDGHLTLTASAMPGTDATSCDGSTATTLPGTALTTSGNYLTLSSGQTQLLCLRGTLDITAVAGATYTGSYTFGAIQQQ